MDTPVVRLGAWCDIETEDEARQRFLTQAADGDDGLEAVDGRADPQPGRFIPGPGMPALLPGGVDFRVEEFAVLADGRRIRLHADRGFGLSAGVDPLGMALRTVARSGHRSRRRGAPRSALRR